MSKAAGVTALVLTILLAVAIDSFPQAGQHANYRLLVDKDAGAVVYLPDSTFTPGATRTTNLKDVCSETTPQFRKTTAHMKREVYEEYAVKNVRGANEVDHLIPLELGGADAISNLWPQPYPQAHWKDLVENWLHREVCAGRKNLEDAQHGIAGNWYRLYLEMQGE